MTRPLAALAAVDLNLLTVFRAIDETRAATVWVTHGYRTPLVRWLHEHGREAIAIEAPLAEGVS